MKVMLKQKFDAIYWAETFEMRQLDISKKLPTISLRSQWPFLYSEQGVFTFQ